MRCQTVSVQSIADLLDNHPGRFYSVREIHEMLNGELSKPNIHTGLKRLLKREEYGAMIYPRNGRVETRYGRVSKEENNGKGK